VRIRDRIEGIFERWGRWTVRRPRTAIAGLVLLTLALATQLPKLEIDGSDESFLLPNDPARVAYDAFRAQFQREGAILIAVEPDELFDVAFLAKLREFHAALERDVPQVQDVTSLVNVRYTHGVEDELIVEDLLEEEPRTQADLDLLKERLLSRPLYRNLWISEDGRLTAVVVEPDTYSSLGARVEELAGFDEEEASGGRPYLTEQEAYVIAEAVLGVIDRFDAPDFRLHATGSPVIEVRLMKAMQRDIALFVTLAVCVITILLYVLFRQLLAVVLPLTVVLAALFCTIATMAATGVAITLPIQVLPSFLLAVGVCDAIHVMALFYRSLSRGASREDAIAGALGHSGLAIGMTTLTTAGGLASFATAGLAPVQHFGIFGPVGVGFAFLFTVVGLPAGLALAPVPKRVQMSGPSLSDRILSGIGSLALRRSNAILAVLAVLMVMSAFGIARLRFSHQPVAWMPDEEPVRIAAKLLDEHFGGSAPLEIVVDTGRENGLHEPEVLERLDQLARWSESLDRNGVTVGKTVSAADVIQEIHQALNENRSEFYAVPSDRRLVAQEFLLFENTGSDDLEDVVDSRFQLTSFTMRVPDGDAFDQVPVIGEIEAHFRQVLGEGVSIVSTGAVALHAGTFAAMIVSMARSYAVALLVVTPLMILMLGSLRGGLLSMVPNLAPIVLTLGLMGWLGFPIDFSSMMSGAVVLSIAVDDTIHFAHQYHRILGRTGDPEAAVRQSLQTTGRAMLYTSIVLATGFFVYVFATMENLVQMGLFTGFAVTAAFLADVLVAPALLLKFGRKPEAIAASSKPEGRAARPPEPSARDSRAQSVNRGIRPGSWGSHSATGR
jgi:predicted RND superfamily exporter protein